MASVEAAPIAQPKTARSFGFHRNATFAALFFGYAGYYLCRQNLSAAMPVLEDLNVSRDALGLVASIGTGAYAIGKVTMGSVADSRGGRFAFFVGLMGAVIASLLIGAQPHVSIALLAILWAVNCFFQSMGWAGLVNAMSRWFSKKSYGTAMGIMSINYVGGAAVALLFASALIAHKLPWQMLFVVPALVLAGVGLVVAPFLKSSPVDVGLPIPEDDAKPTIPDAEAPSNYFSRFVQVMSDRKFVVMCGLSFVLTLLRTCFSTWLPTYFKDLGDEAAAGTMKSMAFPVLGCAGTIVAGLVSDRWLQGRRAPVMCVFLLATVVALLGLVRLDPLSVALDVDRVVLACGLIGAIGFFLLGSYSLVGGVAALDFGGRRTAGTAAGLLDGVGYLGGILAGSGVAEAVKQLHWSGAYGIMAVVALVGVVICGFLWNVKPK
ncbi:MAG TPA: MFS transporter [Planctomycetota bacterium]|nr:MFS transporter [Planctomycetota bacterium]